ncbi:MAG: pyridoxal-phosphate dependent enzyme [Candidatus Kapabacteria bacterium]|jgi:threonine dehydratase|nr:pyridoxal-phosphate dependent enzyme [Candidatus Kapabacteria bacterium]
MDDLLTYADVVAASDRIAPYVHRTPILRSAFFDALFDAEVYFKCEHLQRIGAFKARGATNAVLMLDDASAARGVVTHSSGNHAQALAWAASRRGITATIVMPHTTPQVKVDAVKSYGGLIVFCEPTLSAREQAVADIVAQTGAHEVHPSNDLRVIAGQGTAALELLQDVPNLDVLMAPVGGGGLMAGCALAARTLLPSMTVYGAEPETAADAAESLATGVLQPPPNTSTIADGLRTALGTNTFALLQSLNVGILTASEASIRQCFRHVLERMKQLVEPSATVTLGALMERPGIVAGKRVGIILCGGNVDVDRLPL